jgi:eukaryotic-like serine/threonine-protein kinase
MIGRRLNERYKILSRLGDGGMSVVYKAEDLILERLVAVKVLRGEFSSDEAFIRRFRREAESVASLSNPNIVNIYDIGEEDDLHYIVMELVDGITLKNFIQNYSPLPSKDAIYILKQIASALEHAHQNGIVHRDVKPQNILIDDEDHVKVTDFGIALAVSSATITFTNSIMGSAHYLSPEQAKGGKATAKSDIYAFGIVMYEMLTGKLPFPGESPVTVALKHLNETFIRPRDLNPNIPQSLENIIIKSMAKSPDDRFESMGELYHSLITALDPDRLNEEPIVLNTYEDPGVTKVLPAIGNKVQNESSGVHELPPEEQKKPTDKKKRKKAWIWGIVIGIIVLLLAIATFFALPKLLYVKNVTVPNVSGKSYDQAVDLLSNKHLYVKKMTVQDDQRPTGIVINQNPISGESVKINSTVILYVSKGPAKEEVPEYIGYDKSTVEQLLKGNQYKDVVWNPIASDTVPAGQVISQKPDPNTTIIPSETILELTYSTGPEMVSVPDVTGKTQSDAQTALENAGLTVNFQDGDYSDTVKQGSVLSTDPVAGNQVQKNSTITVYLSKGPQAQPISTEVSIPVDVSSDTSNGNGNGKGKGNGNGGGTHIQIIYTDNSHQDAIFKDEVINQAKTYTLPLTINPGSYASYQVLENGQVTQQDTIQYSDVQNSQ